MLYLRWTSRTVWALSVLGAFALGLVTGCESLRLFAPPSDKKIEKEATAFAPALPAKKSFRESHFAFHADFDLKQDSGLVRELSGLPDQVYRELQLPASNTLIQVYIFESRDKYERFMAARYKDLPRRRAFFVAQPRTVGGGEDLMVFTYKGERLRQDLRHELTHALLHSVLKDVPLWLDEGLAEYYEAPPEQRGVNAEHLELLRRDSLKPDLTRLEQLDQVLQMAPAEYREAWAWVHFMLRGDVRAKAVLLAYLNQLRTNASVGSLLPRLEAELPAPNEALAKHLSRLDHEAGSILPVRK